MEEQEAAKAVEPAAKDDAMRVKNITLDAALEQRLTGEAEIGTPTYPKHKGFRNKVSSRKLVRK